MKFRTKPSLVDAIRVSDGSHAQEWPKWLDHAISEDRVAIIDGAWRITTIEGVMPAYPGNWIIRGVKGELYPCRDDIFQATYELAEGTAR